MPLAFNPSSPITSGSGVTPWKIQSSDYTARSSERILIDTSAAAWALTLPKDAEPGDEIDLFGVSGLEINPLTVNLGGAKFQNQVLASLKLIKNDYVKLVYAGLTIGWMASNKFNLEINLPVIEQELLLDKYPGASFALSLRKLRKSFGSDFIISTNGLVDTWKDQSQSARDAFKNPNSRISFLANGLNEKPGLSFDGNSFLVPPSLDETSFSIFLVVKILANLSGYKGLFASTNFMVLSNLLSGKWGTYGNSDKPANTQLVPGISYLLEMHASGNTGEFYINNQNDGTFDSTSGQTNHIGGMTSGNQGTACIMSEIIFYPFNNKQNRETIASDILNYYQIV
jgi:hypothetical protein